MGSQPLILPFLLADLHPFYYYRLKQATCVRGVAPMGRVARTYLRKALPSILIGMAAAALVRYIAESRLVESSSQHVGKPDSKRPFTKGEPATNGHQKTHPDRLASFSEGTF
ncbi:MAG TPA: hypothetical protein VHJ40_03230 [Actinomycetota bacterium]|nr:hypothetical protein [Actinomycetota bacterium]